MGLAVAAGAFLGFGDEARAAGNGISSLHASYKYVGDSKQEAALAKAIDHAIDGLPPGIYEMAYKRISSTQKPAPRIVLDIEGQDIRIQRAPAQTIHTTQAKPKHIVFNQGERYVWRQNVSGNTVTQRITGVGSRTRMSYSLNEDGSRLTFKVLIDADLLPRPVEYRLTYMRES
jgi:hypothetical protein